MGRLFFCLIGKRESERRTNNALAEERRKEFEAKHKEYKQIKLNLQQMKEKYGFED